MGDKEASFAGGRAWIGSFEVGFCVNYMSRVQRRAAAGGDEEGERETFEIACRSVHMGGAAELAEPSNARLLLAHFERVGTPVMIGACASCSLHSPLAHFHSTDARVSGSAGFFLRGEHANTRLLHVISYANCALGGDMYAYTIAGVAYDEASGQVNYLVLDPHFCAPTNSPTGELSLIHKKVASHYLHSLPC